MGTTLKKSSRRRVRRNLKILIGIAALLLLVLTILLCTVLRRGSHPADTPPDGSQPTMPVTPTVSVSLPQGFIDQNTSSAYIVLYDLGNEKTLYEKQADKTCYPASLTKLLTAIVTVRFAPADAVFTVGEEIRLIDPESSRANLRIGNRLDLQTLLEALLLPSGNDAAYTAAAHVGRILAGNSGLPAQEAIRVFCEQMNKTAAELGAGHSHFSNPDGIHSSNHYTTAADMLLIAKYAYAQPQIAAVMREESVTCSFLSGETGVAWRNSNYLLRTDHRLYYSKATGMKTGHTDEAGYCLAASAEDGGTRLLAILMNSQTSDGRFEDAAGLFSLCFDN